jgi:CRP-like cAMP-binding protein/tRNA A-37 threonylcarbamoyl transferase component Bud32
MSKASLSKIEPIADAPALPAKIGKYRVTARLGEGATSEVFLAHDDFQNRDVAIKRVRAAALGDSIEAHHSARFFAAEAALAGRLQHPNVVQIFDAVPDPAEPYLVMEYVAGGTLRPYCRADQLLPLETIVEIGFKLAMALSYVFRQGLIHRDVKPANLLLTLDDHGAIRDVKISDFGSVLNLGSDVTQIHRVGSLAYMSPEQLEGGTLDCRADMYSLGAVLYHLIAGRPTFDGQVQSAMMHQIYRVKPAPLTGVRRGVSAELDAVIQRALAKTPGRALRRLERVRAGAFRPRGRPEGAARRLAGRARFGALHAAAQPRILRQLRRRRAVGSRAPREVAALPIRHALYRKGETGNSFHILAQGEVEVFRDAKRVAQLGAGTSVGEMAYLAPSPELKRHSTDVIVSKAVTTISFTPNTLVQLSANCRHMFHDSFIRVLVRRLHTAHEALAHPRRIL